MSVPMLTCYVRVSGICLRKPPVKKQERLLIRLTEKSVNKPLFDNKTNSQIVQEKQRLSTNDEFWWDDYEVSGSCESPTSPIITAGMIAAWGEGTNGEV